MNKLIRFILTSLFLSIPAFAQEAEKGKMAGTVIDTKDQEPLAGVNVELKGTYMGAATDLDGQFLIMNVSPGYYDIEVSIIGYKIYLKTGVEVGPGETKIIEVELEESILAFGEEIEVIGKRPLLEVDLTSSEESFSSADIEQKIVESLDDIVAQQAGVVKIDGEIHIRGGRADESLYIIDGVSVKDPLSGYGNTVYVNPDAIKELKIVTGGFNAEYGQAMSGVIDVITKEGADTYSGSFKLKSDHLGLGAFNNANTQIAEFNFGGPEPLTNYILPVFGIKLPGQLSLFISGYGNISDTYLNQANRLYPSRSSLDAFAPRQENDWHILGKLTWKINPGQKISFSYDRSLGINQGFFRRYLISSAYYPYDFSLNLDSYPTFTSEAILVNLIWKHTVSQRTFYEVTVSDFYNTTHSSVQNKHWSDYSERLDLYPIRYFPDSQGNLTIRRGDGFYDHGDYGQWYDYYSDRWSFKSEITSQIATNQQFKAGIELAYTEMQVVDIIDPWVDSDIGYGRNHDIYKVHSYLGNIYIQDQIKYDGMIVN
ncbi:MAG: TonB-dependent receptor, partial [Calditrichia bacterium]